MSFVDVIRARASQRPRRIAFPETDDPRTIAAAQALAAAGVVHPVLIGPVAAPVGCEVIDPGEHGLSDDVAAELLEIRGPKGMTEEQAAEHAASRLLVADALVRWGRVDGCVAGAVHTTGDVVRGGAVSSSGGPLAVSTLSGVMLSDIFRRSMRPPAA